ncbi:MAG: nucleotidyltransferase domain-containing protein [Chitinophagaceae bacterium]|nr:nucleotidyltransferase domain-containing protein [Chitinophagaceae bacterium]
MTLEWIKNNGHLVFEAITGSKAYGLDTATSDTDIRGVYILPKEVFYSVEYPEQVSNETNDIVYYELRRFVELLSKNNPNIMELLNVPENCVLYKHPIMDEIKQELFLSKLCEKTFANYAFTQIKKAYGLEKKIVNPMDEERKQVQDFCYVYAGRQSVPLQQFLNEGGFDEQKLGLAAVAHLKDCYNMYYSDSIAYNGIVRKEEANDVCLSSIPKGETPIGMLYFNKDGYSIYCKRHKEYWDWVDKRNEERYQTTMRHGKNYDSKNMMHVFRLLLMAKEIATEGKINVFRKDRDFLLGIKHGKFEYDELVLKAEQLKNELPDLFEQSSLQEQPDLKKINEMLIKIRKVYYEK